MSSTRRRGAHDGLEVVALYVPGDQPQRVEKAMALDCQVIVDLEDGVPQDRKDVARREVQAVLSGGDYERIQVRINAAHTEAFRADCEAIAGIDDRLTIRLPKVERSADIDRLLAELGDRRVSAMIETAVGVKALDEITAHPSVVAISLGEADLKSSLAMESDAGLDWVRSTLVVAAAAAGLPSPMMSVYTQLRNTEGLRGSCRHGRQLGMWGRTAIHPTQLDVIRASFAPEPSQIDWATEVVQCAAQGVESGTTRDGEFFDPAVLEMARLTLERARATGVESSAAGRVGRA